MMRKYIEYIVLFLFLLSCSSKVEILTGDSQYQPFAPDGIPFVVADSMWNVDMRGNHRAVVRVSDINSNTAVKAVLPWRRPDLRPETKKVVVVDGQTGIEIKNVEILDFSSESGTIIFEPISGEGLYYIYYLPYKYRKGTILSAEDEEEYLSRAKQVIPAILEGQSPNVDTVSGATYSSTGILNAVKLALAKAAVAPAEKTAPEQTASEETAEGTAPSEGCG